MWQDVTSSLIWLVCGLLVLNRLRWRTASSWVTTSSGFQHKNMGDKRTPVISYQQRKDVEFNLKIADPVIGVHGDIAI
jgi:hypothetical protein